MQSPWIGVTWIYQSIQSCYWVHMNRLNQVKRMTQFIQSNQSINQIYILTSFWKTHFVDFFFGKRSISLTFFGYFESIQLIQSYQSLKVSRFSHLLYENELICMICMICISLRNHKPKAQLRWQSDKHARESQSIQYTTLDKTSRQVTKSIRIKYNSTDKSEQKMRRNRRQKFKITWNGYQ